MTFPTAWTIQASAPIEESRFAAVCRGKLDRFQNAKYKEENPILNPDERLDAVMELESACRKVEPTLQRLVEMLHLWTSYRILPLFALANAGVRMEPAMSGGLAGPAGIGILFGLVIGKPLGIFGATRLFMALGAPAQSGGVTWRHLLGAAMLGGIGFTMSILNSGLAFPEGRELDGAKLAVFIASAVAGLAGWAFLRMLPQSDRKPGNAADSGL